MKDIEKVRKYKKYVVMAYFLIPLLAVGLVTSFDWMYIVGTFALLWCPPILAIILGPKCLFFGTLKDGHIIVTKKQESFHKCFSRINSGHFDPHTGIICKCDASNYEECFHGWFQEFLIETLGVIWIGIPGFRNVHLYDENYTTMEPNHEGKLVTKPIERTALQIPLLTVAKLFITDADIKGYEQIDQVFLITFEMVNLKSALFTYEKWLVNALQSCEAGFREVVSGRAFKTINSMKTEIVNENGENYDLADGQLLNDDVFNETKMLLIRKVIEMNVNTLVNGIGVKIIDVEYLGPEATQLTREALDKIVLAKREATVITTLAKAKNKEITLTTGEKAKIKGNLVKEIAKTDKDGNITKALAIENTNVETLVLGDSKNHVTNTPTK